MSTELKDQGAFLRSIARDSYEELVDFASQQMSQLREKGGDVSRAAATTLVAEITSEVAAETAAETAAEAAAQIAAELRPRNS
jgi:hypothetical protein